MARMDYDMIIVGGGVGGLVTASGLSRLGAEVCLIEKQQGKLGGDCLYYGCVPSKTLIQTADLARRMREADRMGLDSCDPDVDFSAVMDRMWSVIEHLEEHDDPERFRRMGVDVRFGEGSFRSPHAFEINGEVLTGRRFLIATGSRPAVPPIDGIEEVDYLTNETALRMDTLPESMIVVGGGPIGLELGQAFHRLGCEVSVIETLPCILPKEDEEIACLAHEQLEADGLAIHTEVRANRVEQDDGVVTVHTESDDRPKTLRARTLLVAAGRRPNREGLNLEAAGVEHEPSGVPVDRMMRTNQSHIYAVGDVTGLYPFTHVAEYQAGIVVGNIVAAPVPFYRRKADYDVVPWCTFTDPEVARVGLTEDEAVEHYGEAGVRVDRFSLQNQDRAVIEGENRGMVKLVYRKKWLGVEMVGAHVVGPSAGEIIHEYVLAMNNDIPPSGISGTIHIYPTLSQAVKRGVDQYFGDLFFEGWIPRITRWYLNLTR